MRRLLMTHQRAVIYRYFALSKQLLFLFLFASLSPQHCLAQQQQVPNRNNDDTRRSLETNTTTNESFVNATASLFKLSLTTYNSIQSSDLMDELGASNNRTNALSSERIQELWDQLTAYEFQRCVATNNGSSQFTDQDETNCPYILCVKESNMSGNQRKLLLLGLLENIVVGKRYTDRDFTTLSNSPEMSCFIGSFTSTTISLLSSSVVSNTSINGDNSSQELGTRYDIEITPLSSRMKLRSGIVQDVLRAARGIVPDNFTVPDYNHSVVSNNFTDHDYNYSVVPNNKTSQAAEETVYPDDLLPNTYRLELLLCAGLSNAQAQDMEGRILNIMKGKSPDGSNSSLISYYYHGGNETNVTWSNVTSGNDIPSRVKFWKTVYDLGIDGEGGCTSMLNNMHFSVVDSSDNGTSYDNNDGGGKLFIISFTPRDDMQEAVITNTTVACVLSLIAGVTFLPQVCSVGLSSAPKTLNSNAQWIVQSGSVTLKNRPFWDAGITGAGQVVAVSDTGLDVNNCYFGDVLSVNKDGSTDMSHRKVVQYIPLFDSTDEYGGHGTHVCGTLAGHKSADGVTESTGLADGVAKEAKLAFMDIGGTGEDLLIPDIPVLLSTGNEAGARLHSASWGAEAMYYDSIARDVDKTLYENFDLLMIVAAGNSGTGNVPSSILTPGFAKNVLTVGSVQSPGSGGDIDILSDFSSRGPTFDGRTKPDIVAPGEFLLSANADPYNFGVCDPDRAPTLFEETYGGLTWKEGTSMATPAVSGAAALVRQYFEDGFYPSGQKNESASYNPTGALIKAILMNGGQTIQIVVSLGYYGYEAFQLEPYDNSQNMGRVSLADSLPLRDVNTFNARIVDRQSVADGETKTYTVQIDQSGDCDLEEMRATLVWADPPGALGCLNCLVNDLDLYVQKEGSSGTFYPNGGSGKDQKNNAERIVLQAYDGDVFYVNVEAANLDRENQIFALVITGCITYTGQSDIGTLVPTSAGSILFQNTAMTLGIISATVSAAMWFF